MTDPRDEQPTADEQTDDAVRRPWPEPEHWEQIGEDKWPSIHDDYSAWQGER